ncbi:ABC transporter permease [Candidatus Woesearchaeota archaeon]|nr:ABC transporter permease [Candidatus Woesearchaeota archaeon]
MTNNKMSNPVGFYTLLKREFWRFFKIPNNTIFPQLITAAFFMLVFGIALGAHIKEINGISYLLFILPGLYVQNLINGSYMNASGSLFVSRHFGNMQDVLVSPISHHQMVAAYLLSSMARGFFLGIGTLAIALLFTSFSISHFWVLLAYSLLTAILFSCCGIIIGLWSRSWEQLNIFINFVVTPLTFLGGVFYTLDMVPSSVALITRLNPVFYVVDGIRYGMLGIASGSIALGLVFLAAASVILYLAVFRLVKNGYNLKV